MMIISWGKFIRRSKSISQITGIEDCHIQPRFHQMALKPLNYIFAFFLSLLKIIKTRSSKMIVLVCPPNFLLYLLLPIRLITNCKVIVDCHNSTFLSKWTWIPFFNYHLKNSDLLLVHNQDLYENIIKKDEYKNLNFKVVPDPPAFPANLDRVKKLGDYFVFAAGYANDEPIDELIKYVSSKKFQELDIPIYFTGPSYKLNTNQLNLLKNVPGVHITGFLSVDDFEDLLHNALGILCLTKLEEVQLCAVNEAIGFGRVPIYSGTSTLNSMYGSIGLQVDIHLNDLHEKLLDCKSRNDLLINEVIAYKEGIIEEWRNKYSKIFV